MPVVANHENLGKNANVVVNELRKTQITNFESDLTTMQDVCAHKSLASFAKSIASNALKYFPNASKHFTDRFDGIQGLYPTPRVIAVLDDMTAFMMTSYVINETMTDVVHANLAEFPEINILKEMTQKLKELFSLDAVPQLQDAMTAVTIRVAHMKDSIIGLVQSKAGTEKREAARKVDAAANLRIEKFSKLFNRYYAAACTVDMQELLLDLDELLVEVGYKNAPPMAGGDLTAGQEIGILRTVIGTYTSIMADVKIITDSKADKTRRQKAGVRLLAQLVIAASGFACMVCPPFMGIDVLVCPLTGLVSTVLLTFISKQRTWNSQAPSAAKLARGNQTELEQGPPDRVYILTCLVQIIDVFNGIYDQQHADIVDYILQKRTWDVFAKELLLGNLSTTDIRNVTLLQFLLCGENGSSLDAFIRKFDQTHVWLSKMTKYSDAMEHSSDDNVVLLEYMEMCSNTTMWLKDKVVQRSLNAWLLKHMGTRTPPKTPNVPSKEHSNGHPGTHPGAHEQGGGKTHRRARRVKQ